MTTLTKEQVEHFREPLKRQIRRDTILHIPISDEMKAVDQLIDLALQAIDMRPHVAQFGEGKLEVILGELDSEGNVYIVPAKHQGKVGEITPLELRAARDVWHDGEIVLKFPTQLQALKVAAALTNVKPEDWVFEESPSPLSALPTGGE